MRAWRESGRFSVRNDEMNYVGQTEADYTAGSDSIILDLSRFHFICKLHSSFFKKFWWAWIYKVDMWVMFLFGVLRQKDEERAGQALFIPCPSATMRTTWGFQVLWCINAFTSLTLASPRLILVSVFFFTLKGIVRSLKWCESQALQYPVEYQWILQWSRKCRKFLPWSRKCKMVAVNTG